MIYYCSYYFSSLSPSLSYLYNPLDYPLPFGEQLKYYFSQLALLFFHDKLVAIFTNF